MPSRHPLPNLPANRRHPLAALGATLILLVALGVAPTAAAAVQYAAPTPSAAITLNGINGRTLQSLLITADTSITLANCSNITILACDLKSIAITNSNGIFIYNSYIHDSLASGGNYNDAIYIQGGSNIVVRGNRFERFGKGIDAQNTTGGIQVLGNYMQDIQQVAVWPRGGEAVQFNTISGTGNAVSNNYMINYWGKSVTGPADVISVFASSGTASSPIMIEGNFISGDPVKGSQDQTLAPDGITLGDYGGRYQVARNNILLTPAQGGIGVAGGGDITLDGNRVYGSRTNVANVGIYVWNQGGGPGGPVTIKNNVTDFKNASGAQADYWNGGGFSSVTESGNHFGNAAAFNPLPLPPTQAPMPPSLFGDPAIIPWPTTATNHPPVANAQGVTTAEDTSKAIALVATDADGNALVYAIVANPAHGTLTGTGASRTYTPAANYNGADSFTFKANDGTMDSNVATVSLTMTAVNDAPVANAQSVSITQNNAKASALTGSDVEGSALTYAIVANPAHGTLLGSGASRTYTPAANYNGADSFSFTVNDGALTSAAATVSITVAAVPVLTGADIGTLGLAGSTAYASGVYTVRGSGADVWLTADAFQFAAQPATGDLRITARVVSESPTNNWSKAGVMIRETNASGSRHAFTCVTPTNGVAFQRRLATGGVSSHTAGPLVAAPYWVRLERIGSTLIGSCSADGVTWTEIRRETITMGSSVLVGLAVTAHENTALCTATFSNVEIITIPPAAN